jgi:DNA processing protein
MTACDACLRRGRLLALVAPRVTDLLRDPKRRRSPGLLSLPEDELLAAAGGPRADAVRRTIGRFDAGAERALLDASRVRAACRHGEGYPPRLLQLADPPAAIYAAGAVGLEAITPGATVTIVGTRRATPYGLAQAHTIARDLALTGVDVLSGMALGIDAAAHRGTLDGGGAPVAVLANGPDVAYPRSNRRLHERILAGGVAIAEMPPGTRPQPWGFPARNRIMAALADMSLVIEAGDPSGSLITADFATQLNRSVGAVPGRVTARVAAGSNRLLADGGRVVRGAQDVLDELFGAGAREVTTVAPDAALSASERRVLDAVEAGAGPEAAAEASGLAARETRAALARLESAGLVRRVGLGGWERA